VSLNGAGRLHGIDEYVPELCSVTGKGSGEVGKSVSVNCELWACTVRLMFPLAPPSGEGGLAVAGPIVAIDARTANVRKRGFFRIRASWV
jgi:hypothetical protein